MMIFSFRDVHPNQIDEHKIHRAIFSDGYSNYSHSLCVYACIHIHSLCVCMHACTCVGDTESVFAVWILSLVLDRKKTNNNNKFCFGDSIIW